jgi:diguanylate cyclase (GGDEF)-like protein
MAVAESIRVTIEKMDVLCTNEKGKKVTASIGVNTQIPTAYSSIEEFVSVADTRLYEAKGTGRNKVC